MRLSQKNALLLTGILLLAIGGMLLLAIPLILDHVHEQARSDLLRAHAAFVESQRHRFERMEHSAHSLLSEPSLLAAAMTGDAGTLEDALEGLFPLPEIDLVAFYPSRGSADPIAVGSRPHYSSPQMLASPGIRGMVERVRLSRDRSLGNVMAFDNLLQLLALPAQDPMGGDLGILLVGKAFDQEQTQKLRDLVRAEIVLYGDTRTLGSTLTVDPESLTRSRHGKDMLEFTVGAETFLGLRFPVIGSDGETRVATLLLARPLEVYLSPFRHLGLRAGMVALAVLLLTALAGILASRRMLIRPLARLAGATRVIAEGHLDHEVHLDRSDELGELAESFNRMIDRLDASRKALEHNQQRFRDFAESASDWLWETDELGRLLYVSPGAEDIFGISASEMLGRPLADMLRIDDPTPINRLLCPEGKPKAFKDREIQARNLDGHTIHLRLNGKPIVEGGRFRGFRGTGQDVTRTRLIEDRLEHLATQDQLTGLANRRRFLIDLAHDARLALSRGRSGVLMLLDLDHLKLINDAAGHAVGDEILVQVGGILKHHARPTDTVARISGDEFAVSMPDLDLDQALSRARTILAEIANCRPRRTRASVPFSASASIGMVCYPEQGHEAVDLVAKADSAMYSAKDAGRNRIEVFDERRHTRERMGSLLARKHLVVDALENDLLELVFQPIASLETGAVHHFETLVRLRDREGRLVPPGDFIPAAEQFNLITRLDGHVVRLALRAIAELPEEFGRTGFSINLSGMSVGDAGLLELIESSLSRHGIDPARITFEVTETAACEQMDAAIEFIAQIRRLGCRISLDDFGVGFSSFSYLKQLDVDYLKIDGSFIRDILENREDQLFVKALVDVAQGMRIRTIAEFVENEGIVSLLIDLGVDFVQGYHVGRPAPRPDPTPLRLPKPVHSHSARRIGSR